MKKLKIAVITAAGLSAVLLLVGADSMVKDRPLGIPLERWVPISGVAGFVVSADLASPERLIGTGPDDKPVEVLFWVKTSKGWKRANVFGPAEVMPLQRPPGFR
jgi:hypothetical protein